MRCLVHLVQYTHHLLQCLTARTQLNKVCTPVPKGIFRFLYRSPGFGYLRLSDTKMAQKGTMMWKSIIECLVVFLIDG